jgi:hypothetical protein
MSDNNAETKLLSLTKPQLKKYAKKEGITGFTMMSKEQLVRKLVPEWKFLKKDIEADLVTQLEKKKAIVKKRSETFERTQKLKEWATGLEKGAHVDILFQSRCMTGSLDSVRDPMFMKKESYGKAEVVTSNRKIVTVKIEQSPVTGPSLQPGTVLDFKFVAAIQPSTLSGEPSRYYNEKYDAKLIFPGDDCRM